MTTSKASRGVLEFVRLTSENVARFAVGMSELEATLLGRRFDQTYWNWRYFQNPTGRSATVLALRKGRIVGKMGSVHVPMVVAGERRVVSLVEGLSILPSERSWECLRGLLLASITESQRDCIAQGFGFATKEWAPLHHRMGFRSLGRTPGWFGFLDVNLLLKRHSVPGLLSLLGGVAGRFLEVHRGRIGSPEIEVRPMERFGTDVNALWLGLEPRQGVTIVKDAPYLQWRYDGCPGFSYQKIGAFHDGRIKGLAVCALSLERRNGYLLELMADRDDLNLLRRLVCEAVSAMDRDNAALVSASFAPGSAQAKALSGLGFKPWGPYVWKVETVLSGSWPEGLGEGGSNRWSFSLGDWLYH